MRKLLNLFFVTLLAGLALTGCKKESDEIVYANLTIEQNKENIQDEGLAVMDKLDKMTDVSAIYALQDFLYLADSTSLMREPVYGAVLKMITPVATMDKNYSSVMNLRSANAGVDSLSTFFAENGGVYTYIPATNEFSRVANTTEITFVYPIGTSHTNNGRLTFKNLTTKTSTNPNIQGQFPKTLDVELKKNNAIIFSLEWDAAYNADGVPTSWSTLFTFVEGYEFSQSMTNTEADVSWEFAFTLDDANILSGAFSSKGDFSEQALTNADSLPQMDWMDQVIANANAHIQLGNLKVTGVVDFDGFKAAYDKAFPNGDNGSEADIVKACELINSKVQLVVLYANEGTAIAKSNFFKKEITNMYWDYTIEEYVEETYFSPGLQFVFKDGSALDQSFFDAGFDNLRTAFEEFQLALQASYSN